MTKILNTTNQCIGLLAPETITRGGIQSFMLRIAEVMGGLVNDNLEGINALLQPLIQHTIKLVIITNDYHVLRSSILAKKIIAPENITVQFLSVSSLKDMTILSSRLKHEFGRINEYLNA